jgi:hypothetical protein
MAKTPARLRHPRQAEQSPLSKLAAALNAVLPAKKAPTGTKSRKFRGAAILALVAGVAYGMRNKIRRLLKRNGTTEPTTAPAPPEPADSTATTAAPPDEATTPQPATTTPPDEAAAPPAGTTMAPEEAAATPNQTTDSKGG